MSNSKSVPLTKDEALILVNLVGANKIVTSKATNATNNQLKDTAWSKITEEFNSSISSCPRETKQLKLKWENLKKTARKRSANIRMNQYKTGGGKPDYIPPDETLDLVASILGATCEGYSVPFGGDAGDDSSNDTKLVTEPVACLPSANGSDGGGPGAVFINGAVGDGTGKIILVDPLPTALPTVTTPNRKFMFGSSSKRTAKSRKVDELAASNILRNTAVAKYYSKKTELLDTTLEEQKLKLRKLELENERLKFELENLKKSTSNY